MILVVGHKNPDSDSICSALVAAELLKARGVEAKAVRQGRCWCYRGNESF